MSCNTISLLLSLAEQKLLLSSRGLKINSERLLEKLLRDYGYARLDAYCDAFVNRDSRNFRKSTSLSQINQVIVLDEQLRNLLFPYLLRIEQSIRARFIEVLAQHKGATVYMESDLFHDQARHEKLVANASELSSDTRVNPTNDTRTDPFFVIKNNVLHVI